MAAPRSPTRLPGPRPFQVLQNRRLPAADDDQGSDRSHPLAGVPPHQVQQPDLQPSLLPAGPMVAGPQAPVPTLLGPTVAPEVIHGSPLSEIPQPREALQVCASLALALEAPTERTEYPESSLDGMGPYSLFWGPIGPPLVLPVTQGAPRQSLPCGFPRLGHRLGESQLGTHSGGHSQGTQARG